MIRLLAIAAIIAAAAAVGTIALHAARPETALSSATPMPVPPYSSAFVLTGAAWSDFDRAQLVRIVSPIVNAPAFPATSSAVFVDGRTGRLLYEHNARMPLVPASTIKLIVAATALHDLGAAYRFETVVAADGPIVDGTVKGNIYLIGGGDPELSGDDLRAAAHELKARGIQSVDGSVIGDATLYGADSVNKTWDPNDLIYGWAAPASALTIDNGALQFTIVPDALGGLATILVDLPTAAGRLVGGVRSVSADADNTLRIDPLPDGTGYAISGQIPYGAPQKYWRSITHPALAAAGAFRSVLIRAGIAIAGSASTGKAPLNGAIVWKHRSLPLADIVKRMAFESDNHIAEQLLRAVGAKTFGSGSLDNGVAAERAFLASLEVDAAGLNFADGSGLSPSNRISAESLTSVLRTMLAGPDASRDAALLPRVGIDGTVRVRDMPADVSGRILGKDGYIARATGLAGYVKTEHHGVVIYAFLVDAWDQGLDAVWAGEDEILARIARM